MKAHQPHRAIIVRKAHTEDMTAAAALSGQLGYPSTSKHLQHRFNAIEQREDHCVYVGEAPDGQIAGWIHVYLRPLLIRELHAEIGGLVVDRSRRGEDVGRLLLTSAEAWASEHGCDQVVIRSNTVRADAHAFYRSLGYETIKTQNVFVKNLCE